MFYAFIWNRCSQRKYRMTERRKGNKELENETLVTASTQKLANDLLYRCEIANVGEHRAQEMRQLQEEEKNYPNSQWVQRRDGKDHPII